MIQLPSIALRCTGVDREGGVADGLALGEDDIAAK
jgi:hypothetical protein